MNESRLLKLAHCGFSITEEQLVRAPALFEVCDDLLADAAGTHSAASRAACLDGIWGVIEEDKGPQIQSQVRGYAPGSLDEHVCLRESDYTPLLIASRRVVCGTVNRSVPLQGTLLANGCYWIDVESGISYLVYRTQDYVSIQDGACFWCGVYEEMEEECAGRVVTIEEPATGKQYFGSIADVDSSPHEILFVHTGEKWYVVTGEAAGIDDFSEIDWCAFCRGENP